LSRRVYLREKGERWNARSICKKQTGQQPNLR
jgi:hypothetical protein